MICPRVVWNTSFSPARQSWTSAPKVGPRWSMTAWAIARITRSGTSVGPGIWRNGRPGMMHRSLVKGLDCVKSVLGSDSR